MVGEFFKILSVIFLAELGDKTQLAVLGFAASGHPWVVFAGALIALVAVTAIGTLAGATLGKFIPQKTMNIVSGILFVAIGAFYIWKGFK